MNNKSKGSNLGLSPKWTFCWATGRRKNVSPNNNAIMFFVTFRTAHVHHLPLFFFSLILSSFCGLAYVGHSWKERGFFSFLCTFFICRPSDYTVSTARKIPFMNSFSGNCAASIPISTFMCMWEIYIFLGLSIYFPAAEQANRSWKYINLSQIYECRHWETEHYYSVLEITVSFPGIHKWAPDI